MVAAGIDDRSGLTCRNFARAIQQTILENAASNAKVRGPAAREPVDFDELSRDAAGLPSIPVATRDASLQQSYKGGRRRRTSMRSVESRAPGGRAGERGYVAKAKFISHSFNARWILRGCFRIPGIFRGWREDRNRMWDSVHASFCVAGHAVEFSSAANKAAENPML
jgi:hypothetical protein